ncbi:unnamed protein product [Urochloa humidicola]
MMTSATTNDSTVPTGTKYKRKRKATTNGTTAMTMRNQPVCSQEVLPPQCTTIDGSTAATDMKHKRKKKKKNAMTNVIATAIVTNQPVGSQEALSPQQSMTGGSSVTATNGTTATIVRPDESMGGREELPPRLTMTNNASTASTGKKCRRTKKKKKTTMTTKGTATTTITSPLGGQEVLPPRLTTTTNASTASTGKKHRRTKKKTTTTTKGTTTTTTIKEGMQLITLKLREDLVNNEPGVLPRAGRLSEAAVHQYFVEKIGLSNVEWVNQDRESGLPYDIVITRDGATEYVEVKEAMTPGEKGFTIQPSEWKFLCEKRGSSSIALVSFPSPDEAAIVILRNPRRLCKGRRDMALALVMSRVSRLGTIVVFSLLPRWKQVIIKERKPAPEHGGGNGIVVAAPVEEPKTHCPRTLEDAAAARAGLLHPRSSIGIPGESSEGGRSRSRPGKTGEALDYGSRVMITGRLGEAAVYQYLIEKHGAADDVRWVNQRRESGLPYDIVVTKECGAREYVEVKTTVHPDKNWFPISEREWKFVEDKGASLSIARVVLQGEDRVSIVMLKDPYKLCEQQDLNLSLCMR